MLSSFWLRINHVKLEDFLETILIEGDLFYEKNNHLKQKYFILTPNGLFRCGSDRILRKYAELNNNLIEFFTDDTYPSMFGFSIQYNSKNYDFFVDSECLILQWRMALSHVGEFTNIDEDFFTIKLIEGTNKSQIYLVQDLRTSQVYACKMFSKETISERMKKSITNEIQALRLINHPFYIKLYQVYESQQDIKLILDYCPYGTMLKRLSSKKQFTEKDSLIIARKLLRALSYLHDIGLIHRDLKLENILMTSENSDTDFKICDFGMSCDLSNCENTFCGSPGYIAPEILHNEAYDEKVDIFSCGVIIYSILSGQMPFIGNSINDILKSNIKCSVKFNGKNWEGVSDKAKTFIRKIMNPNPLLRPSAEEALIDNWLNDPCLLEGHAMLSPRSPASETWVYYVDGTFSEAADHLLQASGNKSSIGSIRVNKFRSN
ncbi:hypothetical protein SteCoe_19917 [Stentor coeruleus]|uniref:Protein kinase domain-containing protein n=1 Tax=Stentor coeruleus TaxID=5963 RepID=A0A1R2BT61_9CILI|nr:hypothetical protein SteCoe_19917 [Stentor coeruleus]